LSKASSCECSDDDWDFGLNRQLHFHSILCHWLTCCMYLTIISW
jgi:hypothetical protein